MATATTPESEELTELRDEVHDLKIDLDRAQTELRNAEHNQSTRAHRLADQLDSLAVACESVGQPGGRLATSVPQTPEQWARCLRAIAKGGEWESGTWR